MIIDIFPQNCCVLLTSCFNDWYSPCVVVFGQVSQARASYAPPIIIRVLKIIFVMQLVSLVDPICFTETGLGITRLEDGPAVLPTWIICQHCLASSLRWMAVGHHQYILVCIQQWLIPAWMCSFSCFVLRVAASVLEALGRSATANSAHGHMCLFVFVVVLCHLGALLGRSLSCSTARYVI